MTAYSDSAFVVGFLIGAVYIFLAVTDYKQVVTRWYGTTRRGSLGIKAISRSVRQMRIWIFVIGSFACAIGLLGVFAPSH
jgi:hypothetical protein